MIDRLKTQQEKLIINERHEAWGSLARKLAHEIKNPLTPIQLTIDRLREKYSNLLNEKESDNFKDNLKIINNQIKQIGNLVNEFSDFARMPKPIFKKNDLVNIIKENMKLLKVIDPSINIELLSRSVQARAESSGVSPADILNSWSGGEAIDPLPVSKEKVIVVEESENEVPDNAIYTSDLNRYC